MGERRGAAETNGNLDLLRGAIADQEIVLTLDVLGNSVVHDVARCPHRARVHPGKGDNGNIRSAAADVNHHAADRLRNGQTGANRRDHRLLHQVNLARTGA